MKNLPVEMIRHGYGVIQTASARDRVAVGVCSDKLLKLRCPHSDELGLRASACVRGRESTACPFDYRQFSDGRCDFVYIFSLQNPEVTKISPLIGPKAGGTQVTVEGVNLNTGGRIQILIGNASCTVDR